MYKKDIQIILDKINQFSSKYENTFETEEIKEEFLDNIEAIIVYLDECEDYLEANEEYKKLKKCI